MTQNVILGPRSCFDFAQQAIIVVNNYSMKKLKATLKTW